MQCWTHDCCMWHMQEKTNQNSVCKNDHNFSSIYVMWVMWVSLWWASSSSWAPPFQTWFLESESCRRRRRRPAHLKTDRRHQLQLTHEAPEIWGVSEHQHLSPTPPTTSSFPKNSSRSVTLSSTTTLTTTTTTTTSAFQKLYISSRGSRFLYWVLELLFRAS